jgi:hypothetical protein
MATSRPPNRYARIVDPDGREVRERLKEGDATLRSVRGPKGFDARGLVATLIALANKAMLSR